MIFSFIHPHHCWISAPCGIASVEWMMEVGWYGDVCTVKFQPRCGLSFITRGYNGNRRKRHILFYLSGEMCRRKDRSFNRQPCSAFWIAHRRIVDTSVNVPLKDPKAVADNVLIFRAVACLREKKIWSTFLFTPGLVVEFARIDVNWTERDSVWNCVSHVTWSHPYWHSTDALSFRERAGSKYLWYSFV